MQPCDLVGVNGSAVGARVELEELAMKALVYQLAEGHTIDDLTQEACPDLRPLCWRFS